MAKAKKTTQAGTAPAIKETVKTSGDVYVCSHLHRGILFDMPDGKRVRIGGVSDSLRGKAKGIIATGGGVYTKISADEWEYISKTFAELAPIKNGLIYAEDTAARAKAAIREKEELRDGFEPIDPAKTKTAATDKAGD